MTETAATCPVQHGRDDRKSAALADAEAQPEAGFSPVRSFDFARDIMRSPAVLQGMVSDYFADKEPSKVPVIFLDGELHKKRRAQLARYFTPKAIRDRHRRVMDKTTAELMARLVRGEAVDPAQIYFRCCPSFETSAPALSWMGERMFIGTGARFPDAVTMRFWELM